MFTPDDRNRLRQTLIEAARADERIVSAALTGSGAFDAEDDWSDIDLAFGVAAQADYSAVVADWTDRMVRDYDAVHHVDVHFGNTLFRVFLLANTLQVDLAFWPAAEFGAIAPTFRLLFGAANERLMLPAPNSTNLIGLAWLHALHARSSIARGKIWQAEYMISGVRDNVLALMCLRYGIPAVQARGIDSLPVDALAPVAESLVRSLDISELRRAFANVTDALIAEIRHADDNLAYRLAAPIRELVCSER